MDAHPESRSDYDPRLARSLLRSGAGDPNAEFREHQEEAIRYLVGGRGRRRLLLVQKTGWGKSFVYFIAAKLLRLLGSGPVILISPLLALMRNQIAMTERLGVRAGTINSSNQEEWDSVIGRLAGNEIDILLIAPERLANEQFREEVYPVHLSRAGMWVVDEAHCISDWGHDFRPDYRRIESLVRRLPDNVPLLATTATANDRVIEDLETVLGPGLEVVRGSLDRPSLLLQTIDIPLPKDRLAWLAEQLPKLAGSGIIYTLTIPDAEQAARWLQSRGLDVRAYTGPTDSMERIALEEALINNEVKALTATPALGMGFDKPDLGFVIHYQAPGSVITYYQQVGRAGRGIGGAYGVLLSGKEDKDIIDFFRESAFPTRSEVQEVLEALYRSGAGLSLNDLQARVNIKHKRLAQTLKLLMLETPAPLVKQGYKYQLTPHRLGGGFWERVERLDEIRLREQAEMQEYIALSSGHMEFLIEALNGAPAEIGNTHGLQPLPAGSSYDMQVEAEDFLSREWYSIEPRKRWPAGGLTDYEVKGNIGEDHRHLPGKALCRWGSGTLGRLVEQGKYQDKRFSDRLITACVKLLREWNPEPRPRWVACAPSRKHPNPVADFARRLAADLGLPFHAVLENTGKSREHQKQMRNSHWQARNIDGAFKVNTRLAGRGPVLLVDDIVDSGWTMTVCAWLLRKHGCGEVHPLALSKAGGS